jgi:5-formyltetrahydrofolate cyclo-ligase
VPPALGRAPRHRPMTTTPADTAALRRQLRAARAAIPAPLRRAAATALVAQARRVPTLWHPKRIAGYHAVGSELDLGPLLAALVQRGATLHLPRLEPRRAGRMTFRRTAPDAPLIPNRFGIPEPGADAPRVDARFLDLVFLPLVGVDATGTRLGSGAGYYDRALAFRRARRHWRTPLLVGVGYALQEVPTLVRQPWDVPLDALLTEQGFRMFPPEITG